MLQKPSTTDPDQLFEGFEAWAASRNLELYPHQSEAAIDLALGDNVILATPTGSGKSLVAIAAHYVALARGMRSFYTAPLKALVSEKFFDLVDIFGAENVGMMTGDAAVNAEAPIICCTAEILANIALREGASGRVGQVVMDEFHFYADPQRGWAWQVPLLELTNAQFLLMSATLGDVTFFADDLRQRTGRSTDVIDDAERPVPLTYAYSTQPLAELITELVHTHRSPAYIVHFTQAAAIETAQAMLSTSLLDKEARQRIAEQIGDFHFTGSFGSTLSRLLRAGIGVHHAGMLPKYRRLVEKLTQAGVLAIVCGTDTLGVGINVPIRTVVFTSLVKFDGERMRHLTAREFHQIAGRAGRAGFDTLGEVIVQAPEHVIENAKALAKAGDDERKRRKIVRKKAPAGAVNWTDKTFERLRDSLPEPLTSQFRITHSMALQMLTREDDPVAAMYKLLTDNHEPTSSRNPNLRRAVAIYQTLKRAGLVRHILGGDADGRTLSLVGELPDHFALNQPLSPFALACVDLLDSESPTFALDIVSVFEAILEDPRPALYAQQRAARDIAVASMKAEGWDYNERMEALEEVTYPKPLAEMLNAALATYSATHPWVADYELSPKSVVRDMVESAMSFSDFISRYQLGRSEGVVLRYLTDAYRTLKQSVPDSARTEELEGIVTWIGQTVRAVDSSLLEEWESMTARIGADKSVDPQDSLDEEPPVPPAPQALSARPRELRAAVRKAMARRIELAARRDYSALGTLDAAAGWVEARWRAALEEYYREYEDIGLGPQAGGPAMTVLEPDEADPLVWRIRQIIDDPYGDHDWGISALLDIPATNATGVPAIRVTDVGPNEPW